MNSKIIDVYYYLFILNISFHQSSADFQYNYVVELCKSIHGYNLPF